MIVTPEDRQPDSDEALADRLRGRGVSWPDSDVRSALGRLVELLGGGAGAHGLAAGVLTALASRRWPRPICSLGAYLGRLDDDQLLGLREVRGVRARAAGSGPHPAPLRQFRPGAGAG